MKVIFIVIPAIIICVLGIIYGPQITIWALNTLFGLNIPINLATWFATFWLTLLVFASSVNTSCKSN